MTASTARLVDAALEGRRSRQRLVVPVAVGLILAQLAYRAWVSAHSYWEGDDFQLISQTFGPGGRSLNGLLTGIRGHVMPAGLYVTWLVNRIVSARLRPSPAGVTDRCSRPSPASGFLRLLLVGFGRRWGIVPPLVLYAGDAFTVQSSVWWATGVQALPVQIAFFWAMSYQVSYLQSRRAVHALAATAWVVVGLLFYEKSLLVIGTMAIVTVAYFTQGSAGERLRTVWRTYRLSVLANLALGVVLPGALRALRAELRPRTGDSYADRTDRGRDGAAVLGYGHLRRSPPVEPPVRLSRLVRPALLSPRPRLCRRLRPRLPGDRPVADSVDESPAAARLLPGL